MTSSSRPRVDQSWRKYMTDYNEGLGLVYERIALNDFLEKLLRQYKLRSSLEAPIYGMAGVSGINSVRLAQLGSEVTLVDWDQDRLTAVRHIWEELKLPAEFVRVTQLSQLPFDNRTFDLAWNWAALWYLPHPEPLIREMVRVSTKLVFIAMPNRAQLGYLLRKFILERDFVNFVDESWADCTRVKRVLVSAGVKIIDEGVLDVPPWPDTVMPAARVLEKFGLRTNKFSGQNWDWSTMDYYLGRRPELKSKMSQYAFLEHAPVPWRLKSIWAHHRYVVGSVAG